MLNLNLQSILHSLFLHLKKIFTLINTHVICTNTDHITPARVNACRVIRLINSMKIDYRNNKSLLSFLLNRPWEGGWWLAQYYEGGGGT